MHWHFKCSAVCSNENNFKTGDLQWLKECMVWIFGGTNVVVVGKHTTFSEIGTVARAWSRVSVLLFESRQGKTEAIP